MRISRFLALAPLALGIGLVASGVHAGDKGFVELFNGKDLTGWKTILQNGKPDDNKTFTVKESVIVVTGQPNGYFYTDKSYKNYVLQFDWKYIKDGNSGCLVHIQGKHQVWPKCIEVQGLQSDHGNIFPVGKIENSFKKNAEAQKKAIKMGQWNTTEIICKDGEITSKINGIQVATGKSELTQGPFGFQSEGTVLHFKNIKIKVTD
ncbi:MAG: DUF1080 domain-containing protein [Planctomycetes bacterium]|nr:DUF1080 domain-containing protein [Planctomycetota bacterium]